MALPDSAKIVRGTTLVFSDSTYSPTDSQQPTGTDAQLNLQGLGISGAARESAVLDMGSVNLDLEAELKAYIEFASAPTAGGTVDLYLGWSDSATGNRSAGLTGADSAYTGYGSADEGIKQLEYAGSLVASAAATLQVATVSVVSVKARFLSLVVVNNTSVSLANADVIETAVSITPFQYQVQD